MWFSSVLRSCGLAVLQSLRLLCALCPVLCALRPAVTKTDRGRLLTATPPGWTWCYCPLPRAKPGLLEGQPSGLVVLIAIFVTWQYRHYLKSSPQGRLPYCNIVICDTSTTGKPGVISGLLTPEVSSSNSPGIAPGKWRPTTSTTPEGLTSN